MRFFIRALWSLYAKHGKLQPDYSPIVNFNADNEKTRVILKPIKDIISMNEKIMQEREREYYKHTYPELEFDDRFNYLCKNSWSMTPKEIFDYLKALNEDPKSLI